MLLTMAVIGMYLAIGSLIALVAWSRSDKTEWLADNALITGLTLMSVMVFWPRVFVVFLRVIKQRIMERRNSKCEKCGHATHQDGCRDKAVIAIPDKPLVLETQCPCSPLHSNKG